MSARPTAARYELRRELGRGATGVVHEALDRAADRRVALKVLSPPGPDAEAATRLAARFRGEAGGPGDLGHPNIVTLHDFVERTRLDDGREIGPLLVMEHVSGVDLKSRLARGGRLSMREVSHVMGQLLAALRHAHARGIVHRNIKPANVLLRKSGRVQLTDFAVTRSGRIPGAVTYMAPEQLAGEPVDARADLYACGAILHELLLGEPPVPEAPKRLDPALPPALDAVIRKALARRPADRFADAAGFARALAGALAHTGAEATPAAPPARPPRPEAATRRPAPPRARPAAEILQDDEPASPRAGLRATMDAWGGPRIVVQAACVLALAVGAWFYQRSGGMSLRSPEEAERMAWDRAAASDQAAAYVEYLRHHPHGSHEKLARIQLVRLAHGPQAADRAAAASR